MPDPFTYIWAYEVSPQSVGDFLDLYGPEGAWVALFRRSAGYVDTELMADRNRPGRFVTIDRWESIDAFTGFRAEFSEEFERLERLGEQLTRRETPLGEFDPAL